MIGYICLAWIGYRISAPTWYFVIVTVGWTLKIIDAVVAWLGGDRTGR